jgi:hypothetical protein
MTQLTVCAQVQLAQSAICLSEVPLRNQSDSERRSAAPGSMATAAEGLCLQICFKEQWNEFARNNDYFGSFVGSRPSKQVVSADTTLVDKRSAKQCSPSECGSQSNDSAQKSEQRGL